MKRRRHTPGQIITKLREVEERRSRGENFADIAKALAVSEHTIHRWRGKFGAMSQDEAKRLKELEKENTQLKKLVANQAMDNAALKELLEKKW